MRQKEGVLIGNKTIGLGKNKEDLFVIRGDEIGERPFEEGIKPSKVCVKVGSRPVKALIAVVLKDKKGRVVDVVSKGYVCSISVVLDGIIKGVILQEAIKDGVHLGI